SNWSGFTWIRPGKRTSKRTQDRELDAESLLRIRCRAVRGITGLAHTGRPNWKTVINPPEKSWGTHRAGPNSTGQPAVDSYYKAVVDQARERFAHPHPRLDRGGSPRLQPSGPTRQAGVR